MTSLQPHDLRGADRELRRDLARERASTYTLAADYGRLLAGLHLIRDAYREYDTGTYGGRETLRRIGQVLDSLRTADPNEGIGNAP